MDNNNISTVEGEVSLNIEKPKRILHFSDGTLEDSSSDNESEEKMMDKEVKNQVVENDLTWGPWFLHKSMKTGKTILAGCDYVGESLASFLGITTPKYASAIDEFRRNIEENRKLEKQRIENASWQETKELNSNEAITIEPTAATNHDERF